MYKDITGIILSGGKSSRMGRNKSFLKVGDKTIIERVRDLLQGIFHDVILITNDPDEYKFLDLPMFEDVYKHKGPLAGIHSGLMHSSTESNFIISCDIPFMTQEMIKYLVDYNTAKIITIAKADGFIQQLAGKYSKECLDDVEEILKEQLEFERKDEIQKKRRCNVLKLIDRVGAEIINAEMLPFYNEDLYLNMNKSEDYELLLHKFHAMNNGED
jgi:molybdopterin-guanine dinucleotide biosynthesis protein A